MLAFRLLGPLELRDSSDRLVLLPRRKQRALLALLLLRAGTIVGTGEIVEALWGGRPPASARANLYSYISDLRRTLSRVAPTDDPRPQSTSAGYQLDVGVDEYDALVFEELSAAGRRELAARRPALAAESLARALGLWRGPALWGVDPHPWVLPYTSRLEEARLATFEDQVEARLLLGQHADLAVELSDSTQRHPLRERLWGQFMLALYRSGHTARALQAYNRLADLMEGELGTAPGPALRKLHRQIRADDPMLRLWPEVVAGAPPPAAEPVGGLDATGLDTRPVAALLPPDIPDFTGRGRHVKHLCALLGGRADGTPTALPVVGVCGMAGIGKTALVVHVAHRLAPAYPDGQLYVNLGGAEATPLDAADVLARFLRALGVDGSAIPAKTVERMELYRSRLAGRRVLVVLDNAASDQQVRPLLPGTATCAVLITSRPQLTGIEGVSWADLGDLELAQGIRLIARVAGEERVAAEPDQAAEIVRLCGGLPLAIRVAGVRLFSRPTWRLADLAKQLADERRRLDLLASGDLDVRASLSLSYGDSYGGLNPLARRLFRLLGILDLLDFPAWLAAAVLDDRLSNTMHFLEELVDARLLSLTGPDAAGQQRYRFHPLVRLLARERAEIEDSAVDRAQALDRGMSAWSAIAEQLAADGCVVPCAVDHERR